MKGMTMAKREVRLALPAEIREGEGDDGEGVRVAGYAAVFGEAADIGGWFNEVIERGAFDDVLQDDVPFLINHEGLPLARTRSGTLSIKQDDRGLYIETVLDPADSDVARIIPKMKRGDLDKMSFAFSVGIEEWDETGDIPVRTLKKFDRLYDVAIVTSPAYDGTEIGLRCLEEHRAEREAKPVSSGTLARVRMKSKLAGFR
jgi:Escherichia/Staphylococcus phage prohead protease